MNVTDYTAIWLGSMPARFDGSRRIFVERDGHLVNTGQKLETWAGDGGVVLVRRHTTRFPVDRIWLNASHLLTYSSSDGCHSIVFNSASAVVDAARRAADQHCTDIRIESLHSDQRWTWRDAWLELAS